MRYDGAKKVSGRKRHLLVETQGLVLRAKVHTAALQDRAAVPLSLDGANEEFPRLEHVWVEQGYKQRIEQELGWADFMVRADQAIRRHWYLVCCAFSFCWRAWVSTGPPPATMEPPVVADSAAIPTPERGENGARPAASYAPGLLATHAPPGARLARPLDLPLALLARLVERAPAPGATRPPGRRRPGPPARPLSPQLTNYR